MLSSSKKNFENRLSLDKVTQSLKVGTFLRHSVVDWTGQSFPIIITTDRQH